MSDFHASPWYKREVTDAKYLCLVGGALWTVHFYDSGLKIQPLPCPQFIEI